ncbi:MAG: TonB-dependent receptor [Blastocatellia bacterium]|nr:TonB-dependent receptor [Blastocatellia bacterium]MBN8724809.1 TonB-dependent receptor [Acidobacteriota bacterium]
MIKKLKSCLLLTTIICCICVSQVFSLVVQDTNISGVVRNQQNAAVGNATVSVFDDQQNLIIKTVTNEQGYFQVDNLKLGNYKLVIQHPSYSTYSDGLAFSEEKKDNLEIVLTSSELSEGVSITAVLDSNQEAFDASQQTEIASKGELKTRPGVLLQQLLQEEVGIKSVQGGSFYGQVVVRGLTGQRVATLVDNIRFNTGTFTTALESTIGLIDTNTIRQVEFVYGPGSALYGSDALGGSINVVSDNPIFYKNGWEFHGNINSFFSSANAASGGNLKLTIGNSKLSLLFSGFGQRINDLRAGKGIDSHSIATRLFGLSSDILKTNRLQDTGYLNAGGTTKAVYKIDDDQQLSFFYQHTTQRNTRVYFLTNGGSGLFETDFSPQTLDFFYTRYKRNQTGFLDSLTGTFSLNRQRQQFGVQGVISAPKLEEFRLSRVLGYSLQATTHIGSYQFITFGGEIYNETIGNRRFIVNPVTDVKTRINGTVPNDTKFSNYGAYLQDTVELIPNRLRLNGGVRYSAFFYKTDSDKNVLDASGRPAVPNLSIRNDDVTFNLEGIVFINQKLNLIANVTRGFRSPNIIDLGSVGGLPSGFEVLITEAQALGGFVGNTTDATAVSTGKKVVPLTPENLLNYELGAKYQDKYLRFSATVFTGVVKDFINQRTLILPQGAVGKTIGGLPIIAQDPITGSVITPASLRPVIVKANSADIRLSGVELTSQINFSRSLSLSGNFSYIRGTDKNPVPLRQITPSDMVVKKSADIPEIEGGLPPATGFISLRYQSLKKHFWVEAYSNMASFQDRLSTQDLTDIRIGATRGPGDIAFFFSNRARILGLIGNGPDGRAGTPDDVLLATGETLPQIQDRVLGRGVIRSSFFTSTPGYATLNLRGGFDLNENSNVTIILENILDKNYRIHGSGLDAPGINLVVRYTWRF